MNIIHKQKKIVGVCLLSGMVLLANGDVVSISYANQAVVKNKIVLNKLLIRDAIESYGVLSVYDSEFASYLSKKGISYKDYKECVEYANKHKKDKLSTLFDVENLTHSFDTILYTNSVIKSIYNVNLEELKNKDAAWDETVKGLIYDIEWLLDIYNENITKNLDIEKLYKYKFGREMSEQEKKYSKDASNLKYILYSGELGRDLEKSEESKIKKGRGYELLEITDSEYKEYQSYISKIEKILNVSDQYIKSYKIHSGVRNEIINKYKIDIYKVLSDKDRVMVYEKALSNYRYNKSVAKDVFIQILVTRGYISSGGTGGSSSGTGGGTGSGTGGSSGVGGNKPPITSDSSVNVPVDLQGNEDLDGYKDEELAGDDKLNDKDYEYLEEMLKPLGQQGSQIIKYIKSNKYTSAYYSKLGKMMNIYNDNGNKEILMVEIGDKKIYTLVEVEKNSISSIDFRTVMNQIVIEGLGKLIESSEEMLLFVNNAIATIEKKEEDYKINEINKCMKTADVKWRVASLQEAISEYMKEIYDEVKAVEESEDR